MFFAPAGFQATITRKLELGPSMKHIFALDIRIN
jgi:hypothetical protein